MRRLCLFSGGLALAAALYVYAVHAAPWPLLLGLAVLCCGLFLLRKAGTRRAAVCMLGLLTGFALLILSISICFTDTETISTDMRKR